MKPQDSIRLTDITPALHEPAKSAPRVAQWLASVAVALIALLIVLLLLAGVTAVAQWLGHAWDIWGGRSWTIIAPTRRVDLIA